MRWREGTMARRLHEAARSRGLVASLALFSLCVSVTGAFLLVPGVDFDRVPVSEPIEELLGIDDPSASAAVRPQGLQPTSVSGAKADAQGVGRHVRTAGSPATDDASSGLATLDTATSPAAGSITLGKGNSGGAGKPTFTPPAFGSQPPPGPPLGGIGVTPGPPLDGGTGAGPGGNGPGLPPPAEDDSGDADEGDDSEGRGDDDDAAEAIAEARAKIEEAKAKAAEAAAKAKEKAEEAKQKAKEALEEAKKAVEEALEGGDSP